MEAYYSLTMLTNSSLTEPKNYGTKIEKKPKQNKVNRAEAMIFS